MIRLVAALFVLILKILCLAIFDLERQAPGSAATHQAELPYGLRCVRVHHCACR